MTVKIMVGDALSQLAKLPNGSVVPQFEILFL